MSDKVTRGLFYRSESGKLFPITIKVRSSNGEGTNVIFGLGDTQSELPELPTTDIVDEFRKFVACLQKPMGAANCFVGLPGKSRYLAFYIDCVKCEHRFEVADVKEGEVSCPNCETITVITEEDILIWKSASEKIVSEKRKTKEDEGKKDASSAS